MNREDEIREELEDLSPFLSKLKKENPFEVPYGYFDKMQREVLEQTRTAAEPEGPALSWLDRSLRAFVFLLQPRVALGALALVLMTWAVIFSLRSSTTTTELASDDWVTEANAYLAANIDEFDDELLSQLVAEEGTASENSLEELELEDQMIDEILDEIDDLDIEDLL